MSTKQLEKAVRVTPTAEAMLANKQTAFFKEYREKGIPASKVPAQVVDPLIYKVMAAPEQMLVKILMYLITNLNQRKIALTDLYATVR